MILYKKPSMKIHDKTISKSISQIYVKLVSLLEALL